MQYTHHVTEDALHSFPVLDSWIVIEFRHLSNCVRDIRSCCSRDVEKCSNCFLIWDLLHLFYFFISLWGHIQGQLQAWFSWSRHTVTVSHLESLQDGVNSVRL